MTEGTSPFEYTPGTLRERFPTVVRGSGDKSRKHHLPDNDASSVEPLCDTYLPSEWIEKEIATFPPGWRGWCQDCVDALQEQDLPGRMTPSPDDGHRNALEADW